MNKEIENINFDLLAFHNNKINSNKLNSLNKNLVSKVKESIKKIVTACDGVLMHECTDFENFNGRDIDSFYISDHKLMKYNDEISVLHKKDFGSYRFLLNDNSSSAFINLDIEDLNVFSPNTRTFNQENFLDSKVCRFTNLKHFDLTIFTYYKIIKYFRHGVVHSYEQLYKLKKVLNSLNKIELNKILDVVSKNLKYEYIWIKYLIENDFNKFEQNIDVKKFWIKKRIIRQNKRKVFAGKVNIKNLFKSKEFVFAFFFGKNFKWSKKHKPLPAISIVGNDGSGKSTVNKFIIKNFSKMDPAFFCMKSDNPILPFVKYLRFILKKIINNSLIKKINVIRLPLLYLGQTIDILDKYLKYKIGMAWADSGFGITIFERYITDKLRGEFPNKKNRFLPLEQYFPMPDGIVYIDVEPEVSLHRKPKDNHTLDEMNSKRKNYLSLLDELSEVKKINSGNNFDDNIREIKNYIFELSIKKRQRLFSGLGLKRCTWKKNRDRILLGKEEDRTQKDSFI